MNGFSFDAYDVALGALVVPIVQLIKPHMADRYVPLLPYLVAGIIAIPLVIAVRDAMPPLAVFISTVFLVGLKGGLLAGQAYKLGHTTIMGK